MNEAKKDLDNASNASKPGAVDDAKKDVANKQDAANKAQASLMAVQKAEEEKKKAEAAALKDKELKDQAAAAAKKAYDDALKALQDASNNQGEKITTAQQFFTAIINDKNATAAQKADAQRALDTLLGKLDKPSWYDKLVKLNQDKGPDSAANITATVKYYDVLNSLREQNGLSPFNVNLQYIAQAIINSFYSANTIGHSGAYNGWENIAWGVLR